MVWLLSSVGPLRRLPAYIGLLVVHERQWRIVVVQGLFISSKKNR